jgi:MtN3 and saliva related transmembrane protein
MNVSSQWIGIGAGICTAVSLLPQLIKILKEKKADNISIGMLLILMTGLGGWIWYGILRKDYPIIVTNAFSFLLNAAIIVCRIKFRNN